MKKNIPNTPINIGNPSEIQVLEVAKLIKKITNSNSKIIFTEAMLDDPPRRKPDISYINKLIGWIPKTNFEEGLKRCIEYYSKKI